MDIGADLRKARVAQLRSIDEIARATKITPTLLRAIENDAFDVVPGGLFARGFLRAYAREVGLDGEEIVRRYRSEFEGHVPPPPEPAPRDTRPPSAFGRVHVPPEGESEVAEARRSQLIQLLVIVAIVALYFVGWKRPPAAPAAAAATQAASAAAVDAAAPVGTSGTAPPAAAAPELTLEIAPTADCWVEATSNGQRLVARLMKAGERERVRLDGDVRLRIGDPGAFAFTINGVRGRALGRPAEAVTLQIGPQNYKTYLIG